MLDTITRLENLKNSFTKPKPVVVEPPKPSGFDVLLERYNSLVEKYQVSLDANKKLLASEKRYENMADFILDRVAELETPGETPRETPRETDPPLYLDFTDGKPRKYYAHNSHSGMNAYFSSIPDFMTKHHLGEKNKKYFVGVEDARIAFRVLRDIETGKPVLTSKGKRTFWACAKSVWTKCSCIETNGKRETAQLDRETKTSEQDAIAKTAIQYLQTLHGKPETPQETPQEKTPPGNQAYDATRGSELEYLIAKRTTKMLANRGIDHAGKYGRGIPYKVMIDHGIESKLTIEDMSNIG